MGGSTLPFMTSRANRDGRVYGTPTRGTQPGSVKPQPPRNRVGEADPATRRAALDAALNAREPAGRYSAPKPKPTVQPMGVSPNTARLLRDRGRQIDAEVNKRSK